MKLTYIQFIVDISGLGTYWSADKHATEWTVEEKGSWLMLTQAKTGHRRRVPITSVSSIHEMPTEPKAEKAKA